MRDRIVLWAAGALLWSSAYADERPSPGANHDQNGPDGIVKLNGVTTATDQRYKSVHREITEDGNRPPKLSFHGPLILQGVAAELLNIQNSSAFATTNATVSSGPASGRTAFLLKKEQDAAIKRLTTNVALKLKLSADGIQVNLAF
jgi:hypothetical protein